MSYLYFNTKYHILSHDDVFTEKLFIADWDRTMFDKISFPFVQFCNW